MRYLSLILLCLSLTYSLLAQKSNSTVSAAAINKYGSSDVTDSSNNIYAIKQQFLLNVLHNPNDVDNENDNDLSRFNRWYHDVAVRTYPSGNLPRPDVLIRETEAAQAKLKNGSGNKTTAPASWQPIGPLEVPSNFNGIGRINTIVIDPNDTNTLYIGAACGGVFISHNGGATWTSNSDYFPSLSIADIAVNPNRSDTTNHTDTIYAATGDGYGYEISVYSNFWGGLYSAGVMKSTDGGSTWHTTGLSYLQTSRNIIQRLLINPNKPNILLAATRHGLFRTTNGGISWDSVYAGHIYSMALRPGQPDTVYAISNYDLIVSNNAGATWQTRSPGINPTNDRATIAVTPAAQDDVWVLDAAENLNCSRNSGYTFTTTNPPDTARFYGYYDRVIAVSPKDSNYVLAFGSVMSVSYNAGSYWSRLDQSWHVHVDNHAVAINPLHPATIYTGNDGGISVTRNGGLSWTNLGDGLAISQIYRMSSSQQNPYVLICGLQDNGSMTFDSTNWMERTGGDGEACAINYYNDYVQISSSQNGNFYISYDQGNTFSYMNITTETADWTAPVTFDPNDVATIYFGYQNIYCSTDAGGSFGNVSGTALFTNGATSLVVSPAASNVLYAADFGHIYRSSDRGYHWTNVTGNLPSSVAISRIAADYTDSLKVYVSMSGYVAGNKVYTSSTGGNTWTSISNGLPNLPVNCVVADSSTPGALFAGTDMGVYYTDAAHTTWSLYGSGLPNVIANDLNINYGNYKIRVATYGRGVWEANLVKPRPTDVSPVASIKTPSAQVYPNPTINSWRLIFQNQRPSAFTIKVLDVLGRQIYSQKNNDLIDASSFASGVYTLDITGEGLHLSIKAIKE